MKDATEFLKALVATPSQVAVNDPRAIVEVVRVWLKKSNVNHRLLGSETRPLAVVINPPQRGDAEVLMLNACLDTAPVGDLSQWTTSPFGAEVRDGWLFGRGAADSKAAVAMFSELARKNELHRDRRRVTIVFDSDEHSGKFGGIRMYTSRFGFPNYCVIGYPGMDEIIAGSRGFYRVTIALRGVLAHAGSGTVPRELATNKLALLLEELAALCSRSPEPEFPLAPRGSVTWIRTGVKSYSVTPSRIECAIDIRLTPDFDPNAARAFIEATLAKIGREVGTDFPSDVSEPNCLPAYRTPNNSLLPRLLQKAAQHHIGRRPPLKVSGPSNIGNFLAMHGSQVLSGFGVNYERIHGPDECIELKTMPLVLSIYANLVKSFLDGARTEA